MPAGAAVISIGGFGPWALGLLSGVAGMIAVAMARWHIGELRRDQMLKTIGEYKVVYEEQDRLMVRLRESLKLAEAKTADLTERLRRQEEQCDYLLRRHYRWTRYVGGLQQQLRGAGLDVPDLPAEDEKS